jgi:hypothetical protein
MKKKSIGACPLEKKTFPPVLIKRKGPMACPFGLYIPDAPIKGKASTVKGYKLYQLYKWRRKKIRA